MSLLIKNWQMADWKELSMWARIGANNAMIGEFTEVEEVPPHGRLIDADALCNRLEKAGKIKPYLESGLNVAISFALAAPTIIPAEEET